jgi:osmotically-inducible protein OsmY
VNQGEFTPSSKKQLMKTNQELQTDVQNAIKWEPLLNEAEIGVTAKDGVVTLTGIVDSYIKKMEAENAAKKVVGLNVLVEEIEVKLPSNSTKNSTDIAHEVSAALKSNWPTLAEKVKIKVEDGWVTLDGELPWYYQKVAVKNTVDFIGGVRGITNNITIRPDTNDSIEQRDIETAISRNWLVDAQNIVVSVSGATVVLTGTVHSWYQKEEAERIAWNTPGIENVSNELTVDYQPR